MNKPDIEHIKCAKFMIFINNIIEFNFFNYDHKLFIKTITDISDESKIVLFENLSYQLQYLEYDYDLYFQIYKLINSFTIKPLIYKNIQKWLQEINKSYDISRIIIHLLGQPIDGSNLPLKLRPYNKMIFSLINTMISKMMIYQMKNKHNDTFMTLLMNKSKSFKDITIEQSTIHPLDYAIIMKHSLYTIPKIDL